MIYVHVPFCLSFCRYCDFYSELCGRNRTEDFDAYIEDLCAEARLRHGEILATMSEVNTLYIGGGTPSVMPLRFFTQLLRALPEGPFEEFTVEVNPDDVVSRGPGYLRALRKFGVNRLSMGVQSLDDTVLRWMGRRHSAQTAVEAFRLIREAGFDNVSLDIIFGIGSWKDGAFSREMLASTLDRLLALGPEHISAYQLSIEEGSQLAKDTSDGKYVEASDDECAEQYSLICGRLRDAGYRHYEISNWALLCTASLPGRTLLRDRPRWAGAPQLELRYSHRMDRGRRDSHSGRDPRRDHHARHSPLRWRHLRRTSLRYPRGKVVRRRLPRGRNGRRRVVRSVNRAFY